MSTNNQKSKKVEDIKTQKKKTKDKRQNLKIVIIILLVILIIVGLLKVINIFTKPNNETKIEQNIQQENNDSLSGIQEQIDEQQKVIDQLNEELAPLVEQRTELENEILKITEKDQAQTNTTQEYKNIV